MCIYSGEMNDGESGKFVEGRGRGGEGVGVVLWRGGRGERVNIGNMPLDSPSASIVPVSFFFLFNF